MIRYFLPLFVLTTLLMTLSGCGGGGGGGSQSGTGADPIEVEVGAALDFFFNAVASEDLTLAMDRTSPSMQYRRANPLKVESQSEFKDHLAVFMQGAASITVSLPDRGIVSTGDDSAIVRGTLTYSYTNSAGQKVNTAETIEMVCEKLGMWRIMSLSDRDYTTGLKFPPQP